MITTAAGVLALRHHRGLVPPHLDSLTTPPDGRLLRALRAELHDYFQQVEVSPVVWRNLPPALVYRAHRPRH